MATRPKLSIRFRTQKEFQTVKRAARLQEMSLNEFMVRRLAEISNEIVTRVTVEQARVAASAVAS